MANWCYNQVIFNGREEQLEQVKNLFEQLTIKEKKEECGQLPDFITDKEGYFFQTAWEEGTLYYETRWSPNTEQLQQIAERFDLDFEHDYEESGDHIYGKAVFQERQLTVIELDEEDYGQYSYVAQQDHYLFEGHDYNTESEILETLLDRKIRAAAIFNYLNT